MAFVYISGLYMPASGGAEISIYTLFKKLASEGFVFHIITRNSTESEYKYDASTKNIIVHRIEKKSEIESVFSELYKSSIIKGVLTQNSWSEIAIKISQKYNCPSIYFLRSPFGELDISESGEYRCDFIIANSITTQKYIENKFNRFDSIIIPPLINQDEYLVKFNSKKYITMINPIQMKGGEIFREIAKNMPTKKFLAVKGWTHLMNNNTWDLHLLSDLSVGLGISENPLFNITQFDGISNVTLLNSTADMKSIYSKTRLLIVPSITPEGGPRVAIEALINGIPVIGSNSGNIPITVGVGGIIVNDLYNTTEWVDAILKFDNEEYYNEISQKAKLLYLIDIKSQIQPLENILKNLNAKN